MANILNKNKLQTEQCIAGSFQLEIQLTSSSVKRQRDK